MDMVDLRRIRSAYHGPIILGGHYAMNYWSASLYADYVWIGEVWDFAEINSLSDVYESEHVYHPRKATMPTRSSRVVWSEIPITQIKKTSAYYWGGIGCKNHCHFCFTSWTHEHQVNDPTKIAAARRVADVNGVHLMIVSNEYDYDAPAKTKDMTLSDYVKTAVTGNIVRCGIEFANDETRRRMGKPITRDQIYAAIQKMSLDNISLKLFHIAGYEPISDWNQYISDIGAMLEKHPNKRLLQLSFTNLQYQNYTPLYRQRRNINPDNYIDFTITRRWYDELRRCSSHVLIGAPSPFIHVAARMGVELAENREQAEFWFRVMRQREKYNAKQVYDFLFSTGVFDTQERRFNPNTGVISMVDVKNRE